MYNENIPYSDKSLNFTTFCKICDFHQRHKAKEAIRKADRKTTTLTLKQKYNKWAQLGNTLGYKGITYTVEGGMGLLIPLDGKQVWGASLGDFVREIEKTYDIKVGWYK